ncbi:MAG: prepilin-type N-terminal cleavage/methylation domain-containing protein [Kiritimatiellae bacterium]|nr:prepilin-type N-terminal cleavage/methylation domain-containing protein [Kiritimatiellia bacterium]
MWRQAERRGRLRGNGFTLIELLVVMVIIGILAAILFPAISALLTSGKKTKALAEAKSVANAWKAYYNEYGRWPVEGGKLFNMSGDEYNALEHSEGMQMTGVVMNDLMYPDASVDSLNMSSVCVRYNPKRIGFMGYRSDAVDSEGSLVDPWGRPYRFLFDLTDDQGQLRQDGKIIRYEGTIIIDNVIAWSVGPDGLPRNEDDINSWN